MAGADHLDSAERDSALSYSVVMIFIILTSGLLMWAGIRDRFGDKLAHTRLISSLEVSRAAKRAACIADKYAQTLRNRISSNRPYARFN
jgi:hypothetical protein